MSIPAQIKSDFTNLLAQVKAAQPLKGQAFATLKAIQLNSQQLETDVTVALNTAQGLLDTWVAPHDQGGIVSGFNDEVSSARDQWRLFDALVFAGRTHLNIDLVIGRVKPPLKND